MISERSPYYQHLPFSCNNSLGSAVIKKRTSSRGIVCPMIKDEEGFLSEWVAYYEVQGFNHVIFYDNNSTTSFAELDPWMNREPPFVEVRRRWWAEDKALFTNPKRKFGDMMRIKMLAEVDCKKVAISMGIDIFASVDLDEYLMPSGPDVLVIDELAEWFNRTTRGMVAISKLQFPSTPHILEPINILTIEAYQTRMLDSNRMNYYTTVSDKVALRLLGGDGYTNNTVAMLIYCCDFHGCGNIRFHNACPGLISSEAGKIVGRHRRWIEPGPHIHHYARSLEKFALKQKSWTTAGPGKDYDIATFLSRSTGSFYDDSAVVWGCRVRQHLRRLGVGEHYVRPGDSWYRNPEFGKAVSDPNKRGRNGAHGKSLASRDMNPYPPGEVYQLAHKPYVAAAAVAATHKQFRTKHGGGGRHGRYLLGTSASSAKGLGSNGRQRGSTVDWDVIHEYSGNELEVARQLFKLTRHRWTKENQTNWSEDYGKCSKHKHPEWCIRLVNAKYNAYTSLWEPKLRTGDWKYRRVADCSYKLSHRPVAMLDSDGGNVVVSFQLMQYECSSAGDMKGGSTFGISARSDSALARCSYVDRSNGIYDIRCFFLFSSTGREDSTLKLSKIDVGSSYCFWVTVVLDYEHFDAFSEVLGAGAYADFQYPPVTYPIVDDASFCEVLKASSANNYNSNGLVLFNKATYYSGVWRQWEDKLPALYVALRQYGSQHSSATTAYDYVSSIGKLGVYVANNLSMPSLATVPPSKIADALTFRVLAYAWDKGLKSHGRVVPRRLNASTLQSVLSGAGSNNSHYHFMGASHMRYNFDATAEFLYGQHRLSKERKHFVFHVNNIHYHDFQFASYGAKYLRNMCETFLNESMAEGTNVVKDKEVTKHTIIFQFGSWDLMHRPLRNFLNNTDDGYNLIDIIGDIVNGDISCGGLHHFLFLTSLPYPYCFDERETQCWFLRSFKNNAAIAASNRHFLERLNDRLVKGELDSKVHISIVDAFSIVKPRLFFHYENEVTCANHFICRVETRKRGAPLATAVTPGGAAVLEAVYTAFLDRM